jgi:hypothetical protein
MIWAAHHVLLGESKKLTVLGAILNNRVKDNGALTFGQN